VKTYPFAITRRAGERRMENCANSRIAVIVSHTNIAVEKASTKPGIGCGWLSESSTMIKKTATIPSEKTTARHLSAWLGGNSDGTRNSPSEPVAAGLSIQCSLRALPRTAQSRRDSSVTYCLFAASLPAGYDSDNELGIGWATEDVTASCPRTRYRREQLHSRYRTAL